MKDLILTYLPWGLSALTLYTTYLQGEKNIFAWVLGLMRVVMKPMKGINQC